MYKFSDLIVELKGELGDISSEKLAQMIGASGQTIAKYLSGERVPDPLFAILLAGLATPGLRAKIMATANIPSTQIDLILVGLNATPAKETGTEAISNQASRETENLLRAVQGALTAPMPKSNEEFLADYLRDFLRARLKK